MTVAKLVAAPHYQHLPQQKATIVLAPFSGGQGKSGVEDGPKFLLKAGLQEQLGELGWKTEISSPLENTDFEERKKSDQAYKNSLRPNVVGEATKLVRDAVQSACEAGTLALTVGGDHSLAIGTVAGSFAKYPNAGLIWIDAHADINTPDVSPSGNLHGCPVAFLMGLVGEEHCPPALRWVPHCLRADKIAYIGLRDVDSGEKKLLKQLGITAFSMYHVDRYGINKVVEMAVEAVSGGDPNCPIHLSYDVDAIDPQFVPATGTPVRGGLTFREGLFVGERIAEMGNLIALDVVECNPSLGVDDDHVTDTITAGLAVARCAMGETLL